MRGRPPKYFSEEERQDARRKSSQKYSAKQAKMLDDALKRVEELETELELLRGSNGGNREQSESGSDIPDSGSDIGGA
jgi:hypothetical protein